MKLLLRGEGLALLAGALLLYFLSGQSWWFFLALILVPDISFVGYVAGPRVGAIVYNIVHSTIGPIVLAAISSVGGFGNNSQTAMAVATIWFAHIGADRALGYGLKHMSGFKDTHLGKL